MTLENPKIAQRRHRPRKKLWNIGSRNTAIGCDSLMGNAMYQMVASQLNHDQYMAYWEKASSNILSGLSRIR